MSVGQNLRVVWTMAQKDFLSSLTERAFLVLSILVPINFLFLFLLFVLTGGLAPTAVVLEEDGPYARQFLAAMEDARSFHIQEMTSNEAARQIQAGRIVAIVTIPATFESDVSAGREVALPVTVNNLNVDFTNDIRRAVPLAITSFYARAFPDQVVVSVKEVDLHSQDTDYVPYLAVSIVVIGIMLGGLLQSGVNAAREYESGTVKELALSPASPWAIQGGKILAAFALNLVTTALVLAIVVFVLGIWPEHWAALIGFSLLLMVIFVALGTFLGTLLRRRQAVLPLTFGLALPLFFLSGPFGPVNWGSQTTAVLAHLEPVYYGISAFQYAFHGFRTTAYDATQTTLILMAFALMIMMLSVYALRRGEVSN